MTTNDPTDEHVDQPRRDHDEVESDDSQPEEKLLDDLDPEEAEEAGVKGGARVAGGRWPDARA